MFPAISETEKRQATLEKEFKTLLDSLMREYLSETKKHLSSLDSALRDVKKLDTFGNDITPEGKDEEVWEYFAEKNLWENIYNRNYKTKQARYLDRLENFLSDTVDNPERHIELFGRGLLWRYYAKLDKQHHFYFEYCKTDDPLDPLSRTLKTFHKRLKMEEQK
ncbi:hypothetical protein IJ095_02665 [Candidatus Saccharibacteria bacterium]|nr:hypothetical protein [Candidatus Saccharibacteria bacterium]